MRIIFVVSSLLAGGAERQAALLCGHWAGQGHDVVLATFYAGPDHYVIPPLVGRCRLRRTEDRANPWRDIHALRASFRQNKPDVIVSFLDVVNFKAILAAWGLGIPVIVSERTMPHDNDRLRPPLERFMFQRARRLLYPRSATLVVQTEAAARWAKRGHLCRDICVIPNLLEARAADSPSGRQKTVLAVGRLTGMKRHDLLIEAFARISLPDWRLQIVGDGPDRPMLQERINALGLGARIELCGLKTNLDAYYRAAGIFVLPSQFEGFPNVLLEALRAGCPVLSSDCAAMKDILTPGRDGILFASGDGDDLAARLEALMTDAGLRQKLSQAAPETAARYFPDAVLPLWRNLLESVTGRLELT